MLKAKLIRSYVSKNGNRTWVYGVTGSADSLKEYKSVQGDFYREDENGTPLFFTTRFAGQSTNLILTQTGGVVADMSAFDAAASLSEQYGGNFGEAIAASMTAELLGGSGSSSAPSASSEEIAEEEAEGLDEH